MKKSFLFILCSFILLPICANAGCGSRHIEFQGNQDPNDDEFIYDSTSDYDYAEKEYEKNNYSFDLKNLMWECDNEQGCRNNTYLLAPAGHSWDGKRNLPERLYKCNTAGMNNEWKVSRNISEIPECGPDVSTADKLDVKNNNSKQFYIQNRSLCYIDNSKRCSTKFGTIPIGFAYAGVATKQDCTDSGAKILDPKGLEFEMLCRPGRVLVCKASKCPDEYTVNTGTGKCDPADNNDVGVSVPNRCEQTRCNGLSGDKYNECVACCHVASSVANWNGDSCVCAQLPDQTKFVPNTNPRTGGVCLKSNDGLSEEDKDKSLEPIELYECDPAKIAQVFTWQTQYANNSQISAQITAILQYCDDIHRTELQFNSMYNQLQILINNANDAAELNQRQTSSRRNIERAMSDIDSIRSTLDQSKWKNADGGFNTSRLLSDSIAGVVLGTASGLIVSHVVKKNQVENGFEDIQCTVGGQVVANWGDEFQVGIQ